MGAFCKMGSLFIEDGFTFTKNGFNFNEWVHFYSLQTIKIALASSITFIRNVGEMVYNPF